MEITFNANGMNTLEVVVVITSISNNNGKHKQHRPRETINNNLLYMYKSSQREERDGGTHACTQDVFHSYKDQSSPSVASHYSGGKQRGLFNRNKTSTCNTTLTLISRGGLANSRCWCRLFHAGGEKCRLVGGLTLAIMGMKKKEEEKKKKSKLKENLEEWLICERPDLIGGRTSHESCLPF